MDKLFLRLSVYAVLWFNHSVVIAYEQPAHVFIHEDPTRISFIDDTFFATYNYSDNSYHAFDIRDSGFPEIENPKNIFDSLKLRYLQQEPMALEQNTKEIE